MSKIDLLSAKQVISRLSIPQSTLYRWIANGDFPRPVRIGPRRTAFRVSDIEYWLEQQPTTGNEILKSEEK